MEHGVRIASFWRLKVCLSIYEDLNTEKGYKTSDCYIGIPSDSGFVIEAFNRGRTDYRYHGFIPEAVVLSLRDLLPNLHIRILDAQCSRREPSQGDIEAMLYQATIHFHMASGMNVADLLANQFSEQELSELYTIMSRNADRYPENKGFCAGLERALKVVQSGDTGEVRRITSLYTSPMFHLHSGSWHDFGAAGSAENMVEKGKLDIFVNFGAQNPFLVRITKRVCKEGSSFDGEYPYLGRQVSTIYFCMSADDFLGTFLYPMETSSGMYRRQHYLDSYGIASTK